jgi:hypothetical protein
MSDDNLYKKLLEQLTEHERIALYKNVPIVENYVVFTYSHYHFKQWCSENKIHPKHARWINEEKSVLGLSGQDWIVVLATDSFIEIEALLHLNKMERIWTILDMHGFKWQHDIDKSAMRDWIQYRIQQIRDDAKRDEQIKQVFKRDRKWD